MSGAFSRPSSGGGVVATTATWLDLTMQGGFVAYAPFPPKYAKFNGVVFLSGYASHANAGYTSGTVIANLPIGYRPITSIRASGDTYRINPGAGNYIEITTAGDIILHYNVANLSAVTDTIVPGFGHISFLPA